jgi:predicted enzyme related to lactoylglutathione lyase
MNNATTGPSLNLLVLRAEDPERLCEFYAALGLSFVREQHGKGPVHHASQIGGLVFEIYPRGKDEPPTIGARIGFNVPSLDAALYALNGQNASVLNGPITTARGRRATVRDPEGHKVELVELQLEAA